MRNFNMRIRRRSGDTQSTTHADMSLHESISNPDVNTHRPIGSAILRRHELRRERGLRVAQGYWPSTVRREHRRTVCRTTVMTPTGCGTSPQLTLIDTGHDCFNPAALRLALLTCANSDISGVSGTHGDRHCKKKNTPQTT